MARSGPEQQVLVVPAGTDGVALDVELEHGGSFPVVSHSDLQEARDRLAWPDITVAVVEHNPPLVDVDAFLDDLAGKYPNIVLYAVGDGETDPDGLTAWYDPDDVDRLVTDIEAELDRRERERSLGRFEGDGSEQYPNVDEADVSRVLAGDLDRDEALDLLHKQQLVEALFETIPIHLYVKDIQGRHRYVSEAYFEEVLGECLGKADPEMSIVEPAHGWRAYEDDRHVMDEGEPILDKEEYVPSRDRWSATSKVPWRDDDGDIVGLLGVTYEVTQRKERRQELERQNEQLRQFAEVVSHDLRNPLQLAKSSVDLTRKRPEVERLDTAKEALDRMDEIIEDVLMLAKYGQAVIDPDEISLSEIAEEAWKMGGEETGTLQVDPDLRPIKGDPSHVKQLLANLFRNAFEHGTTGGDDQLTVVVGPIVRDGEQVGFYVADDGAGIPESERDSVFESGFTTAADGTGFGLSIVEQVTESHSWSVSVTDSEHGGARFEITGVETV